MSKGGAKRVERAKAGETKRSARKPPEIETEPDAWERFERATEKVVPPRRPKPKDEKQGK